MEMNVSEEVDRLVVEIERLGPLTQSTGACCHKSCHKLLSHKKPCHFVSHSVLLFQCTVLTDCCFNVG